MRIGGVCQAQAVISRPGNREEITLRLAVEPNADQASIEIAASAKFQKLSRLKPDHVEFLAPDALQEEKALVVDRKGDSMEAAGEAAFVRPPCGCHII